MSWRSLRARIGGLAVAIALSVIPASAQASVPSYQDRLDAKRFARDFWDHERGATTLCSGVRLRFRNYTEDQSVRRRLAYTRRCTITFNKRIAWGYLPSHGWQDDWWRFCTVAIHEYGHLPGMPFDGYVWPVHSRNPDNIMAASEELNTFAYWWPFFPDCRYEGDDEDGDGEPDG